MIRLFLFPTVVLALLLSACAASVSYKAAAQPRTAKPPDFAIQLFQKTDSVKVKHTVLGLISVDDTGFTTDCAYDVVLGKAMEMARKIGADAIQIVQHDTPDFFSTCHRIKVFAIAFD